MDDPLGYVVEKMVQKPVGELFSSPEFLEELHLASVPGALSPASSDVLRDYFCSDETVGGMCLLLFVDPKVVFTYRAPPTYGECARLYHLQNLMTNSNFSSSILDTFLDFDKALGRMNLVDRLLEFDPLGPMNAEAVTRVCAAIFDKTTISLFFSLYGRQNVDFFRGMLFQIGRECVKELTLRFCDDLVCDDADQWDVVPYQILQQIFPCTKLSSVRDKLPSFDVVDRASIEYKFPLMLYTCDFITDLIQENRPDTVGRFIVTQLTNNPVLATTLVDGVLQDLWTLPTELSCESYGMKILNSMLQLHHCGCISRHQENIGADTPREIDCQGNLNALWTAFVARLPEFLQVLHIPAHRSFTLKHVQLLYLLYPVLRVSCIAVDEILMQDRTFEQLLSLVVRYPNANILHTAVCRLFITCLEDCPVMFGQELQTRRTIWDPLRTSLLLEHIFVQVMDGCQSRYITCFKDIAMSFDELMMQTPPVSAELATLWHDFATTELEDIRADWALQVPLPTSGNGLSTRDEATLVSLSKQTIGAADESGQLVPMDETDDDGGSAVAPHTPFKKADTKKLAEILGPSTTDDLNLPSSPPKPKENASPLQAMYDQEEQDLIRQFSKTSTDIVR
ncbi:Aste57867_21523 [Aphanomyces stellatus]|uniref:Aste57867_21523 protein n=1 Tax=Aphanomyces stellatus TaxID=120398 RepID=A0A485LHS5_9STRA|nr:hypothetical protein As57867_021454 [Aphanomyces stellatus]VFT98193.1 Aste57867_21523 [Aphanomyces stellatus]